MGQYGANAATYSTYQETCRMASDFGTDCSDVKTVVSLGRPPINKPNLVTILNGSQTISAVKWPHAFTSQCFASGQNIHAKKRPMVWSY